ncbi:MAG: organomercurial lyase [Dehalococcoidia bacterium]
MKSKTNYSVAEVVSNLKSIGLPPDWDDAYNRLAATLFTEIAKGSPVSPETADKLIANAKVDLADGREFVTGMSERDENGGIVGSLGLTQNDYPHKFEVDGVNLSTWCAWDTLFIAPVLKKIANVVSNAPSSGTPVHLEIGPDGVKAAEGAVVSFVILEPEDIDVSSLESVWMVFCHQIHFFPSHEEAEAWTKDRDYNFAILSVEDAFEVGQLAFADMLRVA